MCVEGGEASEVLLIKKGVGVIHSGGGGVICMFYQVLGVPHSSSSTPTWGSVLPSIVETRDQNSRGCPLLFSNRNLGSFCA